MPVEEDLTLFKEYLNRLTDKYGKDKRYRTTPYEIHGHLLAFDIGLVTGARIGEIYALDWNHINFKEKKFDSCKAMTTWPSR